MIHSKRRTFTTLLGILSLNTGHLFAQMADVPIWINLNIQGVAEKLNDSGWGTHFHPFTLDTATLLQDIAAVSHKSFPTNALLVLRGDGVFVEDNRGNQYANLTEDNYLSIDLGSNCADQNIEVWHERLMDIDPTPFVHLIGNGTGYYISRVTFDDHQGTSFTLVGQTRERFHVSRRRSRGTITITGNGDGMMASNNAVLSGVVTTIGNGKPDPDPFASRSRFHR